MPEPERFQRGKGDPRKKGPPVERKVTSGKQGKGKVSEAKGKKPAASTTNPRKRTAGSS